MASFGAILEPRSRWSGVKFFFGVGLFFVLAAINAHTFFTAESGPAMAIGSAIAACGCFAVPLVMIYERGVEIGRGRAIKAMCDRLARNEGRPWFVTRVENDEPDGTVIKRKP